MGRERNDEINARTLGWNHIHEESLEKAPLLEPRWLLQLTKNVQPCDLQMNSGNLTKQLAALSTGDEWRPSLSTGRETNLSIFATGNDKFHILGNHQFLNPSMLQARRASNPLGEVWEVQKQWQRLALCNGKWHWLILNSAKNTLVLLLGWRNLPKCGARYYKQPEVEIRLPQGQD